MNPEITPDTSLYTPGTVAFARALVAVADARERGEAVERAWREDTRQVWLPTSHLPPDAGRHMDYRVKPKPVVTKRTEYVLYIPKGGSTLKSLRNEVGVYATRDGALACAGGYGGSVLIQQRMVTLHDGVVVSIEERAV